MDKALMSVVKFDSKPNFFLRVVVDYDDFELGYY